MAKPVIAICPECGGQMPVDPLGDVWPFHRPGPGPDTCPQSGKPLPHASGSGEALKVEGVPVITVPDEKLAQAVQQDEAVVCIDWTGIVALTFPRLDGVECQFRRGDATDKPAEVVVRLGQGFLAPRITVQVEYPKMPKFASVEEADEWMERMT